MQRFVPVLLLAAGLIFWMLFIQHDPFFWDTVQLGSKHAHHFYNNQLQWTLLPASIDSGHPPVFGYYLALVWKVFGKSLVVSHWAMFPFLVVVAVTLMRLGRRLGSPAWTWWLFPLVWLDPVMAAQSALIGPDLVLAASFLLALDGFFNRRPFLVLAGILGLCMISMRGMMTAGALLVWQVASRWPEARTGIQRFSVIPVFIPGFAFAAWFLTWHQRQSGWTGFHSDSPWAPAFERTDALGLLRNAAVIGWRWVDFGRVTEWAALAFLGHSFLRKQTTLASETKSLLGLVLILGLFLSPSALIYQNLSAHRYFLPLFLSLHLLFFHWLTSTQVLRHSVKRTALVLVIFGLATGNLWIYPKGISMGWDATLAHLPYHSLRAEMVRFMDEKKIAYREVGTAFPNLNTGEDLLLNGDERIFSDKNSTGLRYMLVSNVFNDFSPEDFALLAQDWTLIKRVEQAGVWLELHQKKYGYSQAGLSGR